MCFRFVFLVFFSRPPPATSLLASPWDCVQDGGREGNAMSVPSAPPRPGVMGSTGSGCSYTVPRVRVCLWQREARGGLCSPFVQETGACLGSWAKLGREGTNVCAGAQGLFSFGTLKVMGCLCNSQDSSSCVLSINSKISRSASERLILPAFFSFFWLEAVRSFVTPFLRLWVCLQSLFAR